jgi:hypothetical protein
MCETPGPPDNGTPKAISFGTRKQEWRPCLGNTEYSQREINKRVWKSYSECWNRTQENRTQDYVQEEMSANETWQREDGKKHGGITLLRAQRECAKVSNVARRSRSVKIQSAHGI